LGSNLVLLNLLNRVYPDRRDRYGFTILSRSRAIRAIKRCDDEAITRLLNTDVLQTLVSAKAILPLRIVRGNQDNYIFLVQKRIRPAVVPSEWSPTMFADAALLILHAEKTLYPYFMIVDDPHPWNVLFDEGKPYIIDMGAFNVVGTGLHWSAKLDDDIWPAGDVYNSLFLNAVALNAAGRSHFVRQALIDMNPLSGTDTALLLLKSPIINFQFLFIRLQTFIFRRLWSLLLPVSSKKLKKILKISYLTVLERYVIRMRSSIVSRFSTFDTGSDMSASTADLVRKFIDQQSSSRLLIYGANSNSVDYIHKISGISKLLVVSPDEVFIDKLHRSCLDNVTVAVMGVRSPTPGAGPGNRWIVPAIERFRSNIGVFFFNLDELVIQKCMTVSELIQISLLMCKKGLIIFEKLPIYNSISGRNYGQTSDSVLLSLLELNIENFEIVNNDSSVLAVTFDSILFDNSSYVA